MTSTRAAALAGSAALLAAWLSSAADTVAPESSVPPGTLPGQGSMAPAQAAAPSLALVDLEREVARLSARLEAAPRPRVPARNPFTLATHTPRPTVAQPMAPVEGAPSAPVELAPTWAKQTTVSLAGIAADRTSVGHRRTAILSTDGRVVLAHVGDEVLGRYQVRVISSDTVELFDLQMSAPLRLTLP